MLQPLVLQRYNSGRHSVCVRGSPGGAEALLPKAVTSLAHLHIGFFPLSSFTPLASFFASRDQLPNKFCAPKSLFRALLSEQPKLR